MIYFAHHVAPSSAVRANAEETKARESTSIIRMPTLFVVPSSYLALYAHAYGLVLMNVKWIVKARLRWRQLHILDLATTTVTGARDGDGVHGVCLGILTHHNLHSIARAERVPRVHPAGTGPTRVPVLAAVI
jgi:hypothetical protein